MARATKKHVFNITDATLALTLAARIHQSNAAVRRTAISMYPRADSRTRIVLVLVRDSRDPLTMIDLFLKELTDE